VDLPEPDSPTNPIVDFCGIEKFTSFTAWKKSFLKNVLFGRG